MVIAACVPAAALGALIRVTVMADPARFRLLLVLVLLPLGVGLLRRALRAGHSRPPTSRPAPDHTAPAASRRAASVRAASAAPLPRGVDHLVLLTALAFAAGCVGGVLGIGGGSLLAPALVALTRRPVAAVAPLALATTLVTSVTGIAAYSALEAASIGVAPAAPFWDVGIALGLGGLFGSLLGVRLQPRLPERVRVALLGTLATLTALSYLLRA